MKRGWAFRDLLPEFKELTGIDVTIDTYGFSDLYNKTLTASAGHTGEYDVYQFHFPDMALFDARGYMVDITDWVMRDAEAMQLDDIHHSLQESHMKFNGRYYGVPTHVDRCISLSQDIQTGLQSLPPGMKCDHCQRC
jgi:multiple sugar transport system substrate-binding protein